MQGFNVDRLHRTKRNTWACSRVTRATWRALIGCCSLPNSIASPGWGQRGRRGSAVGKLAVERAGAAQLALQLATCARLTLRVKRKRKAEGPPSKHGLKLFFFSPKTTAYHPHAKAVFER